MVYKDAGTLFVTFMQTSPIGRTSSQHTNYAGYFYLALIDPSIATLVWRQEMQVHGYGASLVYKDWGATEANLIIGGAFDIYSGNDQK